jgi:hypothetical protein
MVTDVKRRDSPSREGRGAPLQFHPLNSWDKGSTRESSLRLEVTVQFRLLGQSMERKCQKIISSNIFMWEEKLTVESKSGMMSNSGIQGSEKRY